MPLSQKRILQLMRQLDASFDDEDDTWDWRLWSPVGVSLVAHAAEAARPEYLPMLMRLAGGAPDGGAEFSDNLAFSAVGAVGQLLATLEPGDPEFARWSESPSPLVRQAALEALNPRDEAQRAQLATFLSDPYPPIRQAAAKALKAPIPAWAMALSAPPPQDWAERLNPLFTWAGEKEPPEAEVEALVAELPQELLLDLANRARHFPWPQELIKKLLVRAGTQAPLAWVWEQVRQTELDYSLSIAGFPDLERPPSDAIRLLEMAFTDTSVRHRAITNAIYMANRWLKPDTDRGPIVEAWRRRHPDIKASIASYLRVIWPYGDAPPGLIPEIPEGPRVRDWVEHVLRTWTPELRTEFDKRAQDPMLAFAYLDVLGDRNIGGEGTIRILEPLSPEVLQTRIMTLLAVLWRAQPGKVRYRARSRREALVAAAPEKAPQMSEVEP